MLLDLLIPIDNFLIKYNIKINVTEQVTAFPEEF